jgi:hypothetical protein
MRAFTILVYGFVFVALGTFFSWVIFQMAWHSDAVYRLTKLGVAMGALAGALLIGLLVAAAGAGVMRLGRHRRSRVSAP